MSGGFVPSPDITDSLAPFSLPPVAVSYTPQTLVLAGLAALATALTGSPLFSSSRIVEVAAVGSFTLLGGLLAARHATRLRGVGTVAAILTVILLISASILRRGFHSLILGAGVWIWFGLCVTGALSLLVARSSRSDDRLGQIDTIAVTLAALLPLIAGIHGLEDSMTWFAIGMPLTGIKPTLNRIKLPFTEAMLLKVSALVFCVSISLTLIG